MWSRCVIRTINDNSLSSIILSFGFFLCAVVMTSEHIMASSKIIFLPYRLRGLGWFIHAVTLSKHPRQALQCDKFLLDSIHEFVIAFIRVVDSLRVFRRLVFQFLIDRKPEIWTMWKTWSLNKIKFTQRADFYWYKTLQNVEGKGSLMFRPTPRQMLSCRKASFQKPHSGPPSVRKSQHKIDSDLPHSMRTLDRLLGRNSTGMLQKHLRLVTRCTYICEIIENILFGLQTSTGWLPLIFLMRHDWYLRQLQLKTFIICTIR